MPWPNQEKQWQIARNINSSTSVTLTFSQRWNALISFAANPWTIVNNCNGTTVSTSDLLSTSTNWVRGTTTTSARSWGVLRNVMGRQLLIEYRAASSANYCHLKLSPRGLFTGGTTTAVPTATDQIHMFNNALSADVEVAIHEPGFFTQRYQHIWHSVDGKQTIMFSASMGVNGATPYPGIGWTWIVGDMEDAPSGWEHPCVLWADGGTGGTPGPASTSCGVAGFNPLSVEVSAGVVTTARMAMEGLTNGGNGPMSWSLATVNQLSGKPDVFDRLYLASNHEQLGGYLGFWPDLVPTLNPSIAPATGSPQGDLYSQSGSTNWAKMGDCLLPWNSTDAVLF